MLNAVITDSDFIKGNKNFISRVNRRASRGVLLDENGYVALMYLGKTHCYKLPGGGIKPWETEEQALHRELLEETGYGCKIICKLGTVEEHKNKREFMQKSIAFLASPDGTVQAPALTESEQKLGLEVHWLLFEDAIKKMRTLLSLSADYSRNFMLARDLSILEYAFDYVNKNR